MTEKSRMSMIVLVLALVAIAAGFFTWRTLEDAAPVAQATVSPSAAVAGMPRPDFQLPDLDGTLRSPAEWDGKVLVVNFWATWCPPCRKEIPAFIELQDKYGERGLQFVGIAVDQRDAVQDYAEVIGINYPFLFGELEAIEVGKAYGNRFGALPFTVVVDRQGKVAFVKQGELSREKAEQMILSLR